MTAPRKVTRLDQAVDAVRPYSKAIAGFFGPGAGTIGLALLPGTPGGTAVTADEWRGALAAVLVGAFAVYVAPRNSSSPQ